MNWKNIDSAPKKKLVLVRGDSGMSTHKTFYVAAYFDDEYCPLDPWRGVCNEALSHSGWIPTEWADLPE